MKRLLFLVLTVCLSVEMFAQLNVSYVGEINYNQSLSDVWGYAAPDGTEYAIVGVRNGTSIVSLADPSNPTEVAFIDGASTTWRDIKVWGQTAYVTCECDDGLLVIDLSDLPNSAPSYEWHEAGSDFLTNCHNIYIDEFGYAYLAGCNLNEGGMVFVDVATTPGTPIFAGFGANEYSHDVYTRGNLMYSSEINIGVFTVYDVTDKSNVINLGAQETPATFTHNAWLSDDSNFLFTTDEVPNAPVGSYDVSDPTDIQELDQFRPLETLGEDVIPHNVHVWQDWIIVSYYSDGCIIIDGSRPNNLIEVGNFDTYLPASAGFNGAWGAYPFLPSGLILISSIDEGLYVLEPNYVRACWLEGNVTDADTGAPLNGVVVDINSTELNSGNSTASGDYATGVATAGTFEVTYSLPGYIPQTIEVTLENGVLVIQDIQLVPLPTFAIDGIVIDAITGEPVPNAVINVNGEGLNFDLSSDANGAFSTAVIQGQFDFLVGAWGYQHAISNESVSDEINVVLEVNPGYQDDFILDFNWTVENFAEAGLWERGEPIGTYQNNGNIVNPEFDLGNDFGDQCYMTGNGGGGQGQDDVDDGVVTLISPVMDLSDYNNPILTFSYWFFNAGGSGNPNDELVVRVNNGNTEVVLATYDQSLSIWNQSEAFQLASVIGITDNMTVIFETADDPNGHLVEAAIDGFLVEDDLETFVPSFSASVTTGCGPLTVDFEDSSAGAMSWNWTFEGGTPASSTEQNPTVVFDAEGEYAVTLEVMNTEGLVGDIQQSNYIVVTPSPVADFDVQVSENVAILTNNSTDATSYSWDFGDGVGMSTDENPVYTYDAFEGEYEITLTVENECGTSMETFTITLSSTPGFQSTITTGCAPISIDFEDTTGGSTAWSWSFPGGSPETSTQQNPSITYPAAGTYAVTLEVTTGNGQTSTVVENNYVVLDALPNASFDILVSASTVTFFNNSTNADYYVWDFGDGSDPVTVDNNNNVNHLYNFLGEYVATLTAYNDCGGISTSYFVNVITDVNDLDGNLLKMSAFPNPFENSVVVDYSLLNFDKVAYLNVYNLVGQQIEQIKLNTQSQQIELAFDYANGVYILEIEMNEQKSTPIKVVKSVGNK